MSKQHELIDDEREEFVEKLRALKTYAQMLREKADHHDVDEEHYRHDLMRVENDIQYYEAAIGDLTQSLGRTPRQPGGHAPYLGGLSAASLAAAGVAFAAGVVLGWAFLPRRDGR